MDDDAYDGTNTPLVLKGALRHCAVIRRRLVVWIVLTSTLHAAFGQGRFPEVPESEVSMKDWTTTLEPIPPAPDYMNPSSWALHPEWKRHEAPSLPKGGTKRLAPLSFMHRDSLADVFFIHPTMLLEGDVWNADVADNVMNESVDEWPIRHQASAFLGCGRVFAPRYRQAHVRIFSLGDSLSWAAAEIAYQDVKTAFRTFLEHWNEGRPIVLAGHSQGAFHGRRLIQEFFDGTDLADRLVAAYLPGMDMYAHEFESLSVCHVPEQTGCLCTWMTYGEGYLPPWLVRKTQEDDFTPLLITHPVTWKHDERASPYEAHQGVLRPSFRLSKAKAMRGQISPEGVLWVDAPKVLGGKWLQRDNWHSGDINLFWVNVYLNAQLRTRQWHHNHPMQPLDE